MEVSQKIKNKIQLAIESCPESIVDIIREQNFEQWKQQAHAYVYKELYGILADLFPFASVIEVPSTCVEISNEAIVRIHTEQINVIANPDFSDLLDTDLELLSFDDTLYSLDDYDDTYLLEDGVETAQIDFDQCAKKIMFPNIEINVRWHD